MSAASLDALRDCGNGTVVSLVLLVEEVVLALIERGRKNESHSVQGQEMLRDVDVGSEDMELAVDA